MRLAHLSDIHLTAAPLGWRWGDWFTKRVTGYANTHWRSRRWRFRDAPAVLAVIADDLRRRRPDTVIFSGDASMMGFAAEVERTAAGLGVGQPDMPPGFAVPGNHDYYVQAAARSGAFERCFAPWQTGERVEAAPYPFAQQVGAVWLIGVNSAVPNTWPWDARGEIGNAQLGRLERLLAGLSPGPRILVTHYPAARGDGTPEKPWHALRDVAELLKVASRGNIQLWLHGHRHGWYVLPAKTGPAPFPIICAGSATEAQIAGYNEYVLSASKLEGVRRTFDPGTRTFRDDETFELELGKPG